jgi:hypothetical protein
MDSDNGGWTSFAYPQDNITLDKAWAEYDEVNFE